MTIDALALTAAYVISVVVRYGTEREGIVWIHAGGVLTAAVALQLCLGLAGRVYLGRVGVATNEETLLLGAATATVGLTLFVANAMASRTGSPAACR